MGIASLGVGVALLVGVGIGAVAGLRGSSSADAATPRQHALPVSVVTTTPGPKGFIPYLTPLEVSVTGARLTRVTVSGPSGPLAGRATSGTWRSSAKLAPSTTYTVTAHYVDSLGHRGAKSTRVTTRDSPQHFTATISPGDGDTVGVGQPVIVDFDRPIPDALKATVLRHLIVYSTPRLPGAWHWYNDTEVHYRPEDYWPAHTHIRVIADMRAVQLDAQTYGTGRPVSTFGIGDRHISIADAATHTLTVYDGARVIRTFPMSAGSATYPTKSGIHIALEKSPTVVMDSATVGIPRTSKDGYYETVQWDVRISNGGAFVHSAPWSVGSQGNRNVSHGCINLAPSNAEWFFTWSQKGDVVNVVNTGVPPVLGDEGMADWNYSWSDWKAPYTAP
jgi:lipoprotein-anchoring transpeptidase ErfK/SrfK